MKRMKITTLLLLLCLMFLFGCSNQQPLQTTASLTSATTSPTPDRSVRGNRNSKIYHWRGCPNYDDIAPKNRVAFNTPEDAEAAGYRAARNCRTPRP